MAACLFGSADSARYWQAWVYLGVNLTAAIWTCAYFYRRNPALLERRLLKKETVIAQKLIRGIWRLLAGSSLVLAGYDHRIQWSSAVLKPVPLGLEVLSLLFIAAGHVLFFQVAKANGFAASVIQVEANQPVITIGPYGHVRHPMYLGFAMMTVFTPLALGSFIALPVSMLILPIVTWRILNEEKMLRRALPGYADYCRQTRCRLIPYVW